MKIPSRLSWCFFGDIRYFIKPNSSVFNPNATYNNMNPLNMAFFNQIDTIMRISNN